MNDNTVASAADVRRQRLISPIFGQNDCRSRLGQKSGSNLC